MQSREQFEGEVGQEPPEPMRDGDIFRWRYKDEDRRVKESNFTTTYWCRSQIAVWKGDSLRDTYWGDSSDGRLDLASVNLVYLGNPADMKLIPAYERAFYRDGDVVDMRHANDSRAPVYAKSERDPKSMKSYYEDKRDRFESDAYFALGRCRDIRSALDALESGCTDYQFPIYA